MNASGIPKKNNVIANNNKEIYKYKQAKAASLYGVCRFYGLLHTQRNTQCFQSLVFTLWLFIWCKNKDRQVNSSLHRKYLSLLSETDEENG